MPTKYLIYLAFPVIIAGLAGLGATRVANNSSKQTPETPCLTAVRIVAGLTGISREIHVIFTQVPDP
jgi:predicted dinucleotide-utilizing enzyme